MVGQAVQPQRVSDRALSAAEDVSLKICLLGRFRVWHAERFDLTPKSRKARCLIAYLALSADGAASRGRLAGLLWGDRGEAQARGSLRQCLLELRALGDSAGTPLIESDRQEVRLAADTAWIDVRALKAMLGAAAPEEVLRALELWQGDLLEDVGSTDAAFEDWLYAERAALRNTLQQAVHQALDAAQAGNALERCQALAVRYLQIEPADETAHRALIRYHVATGDRAAASRQFQRLRDYLVEELGARPSAETERLVKSVAAPASEDAAALPAAPPPPSSPPRDRGPPVVVLRPVRPVGGDDSLSHIADSLTEELYTALARYQELTMLNPSAAAQDGRDGRLPGNYAVEGSVYAAGSGWRLTVRLSTLPDQRHLWAERFDLPPEALADKADEAIARIIGALLPSVEQNEAQAKRCAAGSEAQAYDLYLQAKDLIQNAPFPGYAQAAGDLLEKAIAKDPDLSVAYGHLVRLYNTDFINTTAGGALEEYRSRAFDLARKAVLLDPGNSLSQAILGWCYIWRRDWDMAGRQLAKSLTINPHDADRLTDVAVAKLYLGEPEKALQLMERALAVNPLPKDYYYADLAAVLYLHGRYREALQNLDLTIDRSPLVKAWRTATLSRLDKSELARQTAQALLDDIRGIWCGKAEPTPKRCVDWLFQHIVLRRPEDEAAVRDGLRAAGLPA